MFLSKLTLPETLYSLQLVSSHLCTTKSIVDAQCIDLILPVHAQRADVIIKLIMVKFWSEYQFTVYFSLQADPQKLHSCSDVGPGGRRVDLLKPNFEHLNKTS